MDGDIYNFLLECRYEVADTESLEDVEKLERYFESKGARLPGELRSIYLEIGPGSGVFQGQPFSLWNIDLILKVNTANENLLPIWRRYLLFASDLAGEAFAFDTQAAHLPVVMVPRIGLSKPEEAWLKGRNFRDFLFYGLDTATRLERDAT